MHKNPPKRGICLQIGETSVATDCCTLYHCSDCCMRRGVSEACRPILCGSQIGKLNDSRTIQCLSHYDKVGACLAGLYRVFHTPDALK